MVEQVLDDHAALRDVLVQIGEASDLPVTGGLLERLHTLLEAHFAREESQGGVLSAIAEASPEHRVDVTRLSCEHGEILAAVRGLTARIRSGGTRGLPEVESQVATILRRLHEHDERETDLLSGAVGMDRAMLTERLGARGSPVAAPWLGGDGDGVRPVSSTALEVNLRRTAVDVVIPSEQMVLLEVTVDLYGLQQETKKLLREINHRYVGWPATLDDLHRRALGDFPHYIRHERAPAAVAVFCALYIDAAERAQPRSVQESALRYHSYYLEKVTRESGDRLPATLPAIGESLGRLQELLSRTPSHAISLSPRLVSVARALWETDPDPTGAVQRIALELVSEALDRVYVHWLACEDPATWWREHAKAGPRERPPDSVAAICHTRLREARRELACARRADLAERADALLALPDTADIERGYLAAASGLESTASPPGRTRLAASAGSSRCCPSMPWPRSTSGYS